MQSHKRQSIIKLSRRTYPVKTGKLKRRLKHEACSCASQVRRCSGRKLSAWFSLSGLLTGFVTVATAKVGEEALAFIMWVCFAQVLVFGSPSRRPGSDNEALSLAHLALVPPPPHFISHSGRTSVSLSSEDGLISSSLLPK